MYAKIIPTSYIFKYTCVYDMYFEDTYLDLYTLQSI